MGAALIQCSSLRYFGNPTQSTNISKTDERACFIGKSNTERERSGFFLGGGGGVGYPDEHFLDFLIYLFKIPINQEKTKKENRKNLC